jgi:DNA polymerase (family X)
VISTDSHNFGNYNYMKLGVAIARRAWCTHDDILNTKTWDELIKYFKKKRSGKEHTQIV